MASNDDELQRWTNTNIDALKHQKAICFLVAGLSPDETAKELGIAKRTLERWFKYPEFNQNLTKAIRHIHAAGFAKAVLYSERALDTLMTIIDDLDAPTKYRLEAIRILFEHTARGVRAASGQPGELLQKMKHQSSLFELHEYVKSGSRILGSAASEKLAFDNSQAIWAELYPDENYPD